MKAEHTLGPIAIRALQYVRNTNGGATRAHFEDDHEPIGRKLWHELFEVGGFITIDSAGRIFLTDAGRAAIAAATGESQ